MLEPYKPDYPFDREPGPGDSLEVAPGVHWLRMPLPFKLDHINLWLLDDGEGWTAVDTGINTGEVKDAWRLVAGRLFAGKPLKRIVVTHFHPDHLGLAGWLAEAHEAPLWMPLAEWTHGRMLSMDTADTIGEEFLAFYRRAGFDEDQIEVARGRLGRYGKAVSKIPTSFRRIAEGEVIDIGGRDWRVVVGTGHAPEHACLYCRELNVLISGDQVLPRISPNVSVWPQEPDADPLRLFLQSLRTFHSLPEDVLVLPSHDWPFRGLHGRLDDLAYHHRERLDETLAACARPAAATEVLKRLFSRPLDDHQLFFAIGETLAHLHRLLGEGALERRLGSDGVYRFGRADGSKAG